MVAQSGRLLPSVSVRQRTDLNRTAGVSTYSSATHGLTAEPHGAPEHPLTLYPPFLEHRMSLGLIVLIVVLLMVVGTLPTWPHSSGWGYGPSGGLGLVLIIVLVLLLMGKL